MSEFHDGGVPRPKQRREQPAVLTEHPVFPERGERLRQPLECEAALLAATRVGARALQRDDGGMLAPGDRTDAAILGSPRLHAPRIPGPASRWFDTTVIGGRLTWQVG